MCVPEKEKERIQRVEPPGSGVADGRGGGGSR